MFNSTFLKFLVSFTLIVGASFLIMGIAGMFDSKSPMDQVDGSIILK